MGIRTGQQYIDSLRDNRTLYIDGNVVTDVTAYPPLAGVIQTIAGIYDDQHNPAYQELLTFRSPTTGESVSKTYLEARTTDELRQLEGCYYFRALSTYGLMGRLTDFMSSLLMDQTAGLLALGRPEAAATVARITSNCRENDLQVTHALIDPQSDRSKADAPTEAVQLVARRPDGIVVRGCRMLSTLAPVANECYVGPYYPRKAGEEKYALAFQLPMGTPGLAIVARESFDRGQGHFDRPLSSRFDEGDAVLIFDDVFVPRDRVIIDGDLQAYNGMLQAGVGYTSLQACARSAVKLRFLAGIATAIARANGRDKTPPFQAAIGEVIGLVAVAEAIRVGTRVDALRRIDAYAQGVLTPVGDGLSEPANVGRSGFAALNFFFPYANTKAADVVRMAAGSGALAITEADYAQPDVGPLIDKWLIGPSISGKERLQLMKLAWDITGTEFGSRAGLYERLYSGDLELNAQRWFMSPITLECESMVKTLLAEVDANRQPVSAG